MDLIILVVVLVVVGFVVWALTTQVPMPPLYARAIQVMVFVVVLLYVLTRVVVIPNLLR